MRHFTCDLCKQPIHGNERFVAKLEIHAAFDVDEITEADLDTDHLSEVANIIARMEEDGVEPEDETETRQFAFDLCLACRCRVVRDPLGRELPRQFDFSAN